MDDAAITKDETITEILKESEISIDRLHEAKPYHDISIKSETPETKSPTKSSKTMTTVHEITTGQKTSEESKMPSKAEHAPAENNILSKPKAEDTAKIETVFEKLEITSENADSTTDSADSRKEKDDIKVANDTLMKTGVENKSQAKIAVPPLNFEIKGRLSDPQNDLFEASTTESSRGAGNLYSVKGSPSGRINRRRDSNTNVFPAGCMGCKEEIPLEVKPSPRRFLDANEASKDSAGHLDNTPRKRPSSGRPEIQRNPLTGAGMEPTESRRQMIRRKDGNPVLGTGYENEPGSTPSSNRIPPGGYSKGLW